MSTVRLKFKRLPGDDDEKLTPQAQLILEELKELDKDKHGVFRDKLAKKLDENDKFVTKQDPERVIAYYQKMLTMGGFIEVDKVQAQKKKADANGGKQKATNADADPDKVAESLKA